MCANWATVKSQTRGLTLKFCYSSAEKILSTKHTLQIFQILEDRFPHDIVTASREPSIEGGCKVSAFEGI